MALGTTNIDCDTVATLIGDATIYETIGADTFINYFLLCASVNINKWSKYKPVRAAGIGTTIHVRGKDDTGYWGFNFSGVNPNKWDYLHPRGGSPGGTPDEPARLDDFRGYEHDLTLSFPTIQCRDTDCSFNAILYPTGTPYTQQWFFRVYNTDANDRLITPTLLGFQNYYIGIKLNFDGATWYKTLPGVQLEDIPSDGSYNINLSVELVVSWGDPHFSNFPTLPGSSPAHGTAEWELFICDNATTGWQNTLSGRLINLPTGTDGTNTWVYADDFVVADYVALVKDYAFLNYLYWNAGDAGDAYYKSGIIVAPDAYETYGWHIEQTVAWLTIKVYDSTGGSEITGNPALWTSGNEIRVYPSSANTGEIRSGTIILHSQDNHPFSIECWQDGDGGDPPGPVVYIETTDTDGWYITNSAFTLALGDTSITGMTFVPEGGTMPGSTNCTIEVRYMTIDGTLLSTTAAEMRDGYTCPIVVGDRTLSLGGNTAAAGEIYHVIIIKD